jgi:hypothetical protein
MTNNKNILNEKVAKELAFRVPENYFDQFALQIDKQIGYQRSSNHKLLRRWMYVAAMFVGVLVAGQVFYSTHQKRLARNAENYESYVLSQVDETSMVDYYVEQSNESDSK